MSGISKQQRNIIRALTMYQETGLKENQWQDFFQNLVKNVIFYKGETDKIRLLRFIARYGFKEFNARVYPKYFFKCEDVKSPYKVRDSIIQSVKGLIKRGYLIGTPWYGDLVVNPFKKEDINSLK